MLCYLLHCKILYCNPGLTGFLFAYGRLTKEPEAGLDGTKCDVSLSEAKINLLIDLLVDNIYSLLTLPCPFS